jgi:prolyl-tRNA synthetase
MAKQTLTPKSESMSKWYTQVIQEAKLADYSPVKGCMVMRPDGYGIWENIQKIFDPALKELGVENAYFPLFIPMSFLEREAHHIEGFSPELAVVTHAGGEELQEKLAVRPTSETIMYEMYSRWIQSYRDLPLSLNQWNNVVRWEKRTYFFLRTTEFLWQEAHTAHATHEESLAMVLNGLEAYRKLVEESLAIPVIKGRKSQSERFAGANLTTTIEALMPDGKALQAGTSHDLGQNFSQESAFNIAFQNSEGATDYAWQTSFGLSTRVIGALIMTHGDDEGLVIPPKVAPTQVLLLPAQKSADVYEYLEKALVELKNLGVRAKLDTGESHSMGWKLNQAEISGYPIVIVAGNRDLEAQQYSLHIRHNHDKKELAANELKQIPALLDQIQKDMFLKAQKNREDLTTTVQSYDELKEVMAEKRGFIKAFWAEDETTEKKIKDETKATTRCLPFVDNEGNTDKKTGTCIITGKPTDQEWIFAQAY